MSGVVSLEGNAGSFKQSKYNSVIIGTLVMEGIHNISGVTAASLSRCAKSLREAFSIAFQEFWSFVIYHTSTAVHGDWHEWVQLNLGGTVYIVVG
jgi:hypothetical protein